MKNLIALALTSWLLMGSGTATNAQCTLTGLLRDAEGKALSFASIGLMNAVDSALVKGTLTDEKGAYAFPGVKNGRYFVTATLLGYVNSQSTVFDFSGAALTIPTLTAAQATQQLQTLEVTARKPFLEQRIDRMVVNVANSIVASGSTALEVLEKAPGVTVDRQNDLLKLRGKDGVIVQLDGKQTYLAMADVVALLRSMPSENIEQIELITNPSAKYDAAGNSGIINIQMKKNNNIGTNGSVSIAAGSGRYNRERGSLQVNHRTRKLNVFGNYSGSQGGNYWNFQIKSDWAQDGERNLISQVHTGHTLDWGHNAKAGVDYFVGKNTTVGVVWTGLWSTRQIKGPTESRFRHGETEPVYWQTHTEVLLSSVADNQVGNLNLQHTFGSKGGQLTADLDLGHFRRAFESNLLTAQVVPESSGEPLAGLLMQMPTTIDIRTMKVDYTRSLGKQWKLEAGLKHSSVSSDNDMTLSSGEADNLQVDSALSNHFRYNERVNAAYLSLAGKLGAKTELQLGLRAEHTHSVGHSLTLNNEVGRDYLNFFPSLFVSQPLSPAHTLIFSYSYRIDRPNYQNLNPARTYLDPYAYGRGNPYLKPQYTHSLELKHGFKDKIFTSLGASYTTDLVYYLLQPVDRNRFERTPDNIGTSQSYNLTVSWPITLRSGWTLQTTLMGVYGQFRYTYLDTLLTVRQVSGRLNGTNSLVLGRGWTAELSGWLNTPAVDAIWHSPWVGSLDAGLQKSLGTKWKAKFSVQDLLHTNRIIGHIHAAGFDQHTRIAFDSRVAMLNLTYTFGNQQLKGARQRKTGSEEELRRTN